MVTVNARALLQAALDPSPEAMYYVDTKKGDVVKITASMNKTELLRFKTLLDKEVDRFLKLPRPTGEETYADMAAFRATVKDKKLQERLQMAVTGGGTLRNHVDALSPVPLEKERWYKFRETRILQRLQGWLRENGLKTS
ncbi:MAG: hypothetical protein EB084_13130 [Proteobacteria bacterium]|nr:hypothetical protein [Pseudomonadota bacterium]